VGFDEDEVKENDAAVESVEASVESDDATVESDDDGKSHCTF